ncbi:hypothetical protein BDA99DRAFT_601881 [Phascolomyces articulosus]|uniref:Uncharacterized protein n=1 Tax=Phascolomyces articulosus TaxID=60185 RepID=A0AAD5KLR3_9FUNG|nr:hypothetical protein BDA99DRAFT_601881 [Phascolomyces articulosus]
MRNVINDSYVPVPVPVRASCGQEGHSRSTHSSCPNNPSNINNDISNGNANEEPNLEATPSVCVCASCGQEGHLQGRNQGRLIDRDLNATNNIGTIFMAYVNSNESLNSRPVHLRRAQKLQGINDQLHEQELESDDEFKSDEDFNTILLYNRIPVAYD